MSARKIFNYDNLNESKIVKNLKSDDLFENSISACGCLFYKIIDNQVELLLIKYKDPSWPLLDDFGGVIDTTDISVHQAMVREVSEETNTVISESILNNLIQSTDNHSKFYNNHSKYYVQLIKLDNDQYNDTTIFGDFEENDKIYRTVKWYKFNDIKNNLSFRLKNNTNLMLYIDGLT